MYVWTHFVCNTEGITDLLPGWRLLQVMPQKHFSKTATKRCKFVLEMHTLRYRQGAQQGWTCTWMTSTAKKPMVKLQTSTYVTAHVSTADLALAGCWPLYTGCKLLYTGCKAVQPMWMGLCTLNSSSLKIGCTAMKYTHCTGPGGPMAK